MCICACKIFICLMIFLLLPQFTFVCWIHFRPNRTRVIACKLRCIHQCQHNSHLFRCMPIGSDIFQHCLYKKTKEKMKYLFFVKASYSHLLSAQNTRSERMTAKTFVVAPNFLVRANVALACLVPSSNYDTPCTMLLFHYYRQHCQVGTFVHQTLFILNIIFFNYILLEYSLWRL